MNSSRFKKEQLKYLGNLLHFKTDDILLLCNQVSSFYREWDELKKDKSTGKTKTYSDGTPKKRTIRPSSGLMKRIQASIKSNVLAKYPLPPNVHGGIKKKSNITNAKEHQGNKFIFTTDLQDFFPNISYHQLYAMYLNIGFTNHVAHWLTKLTSYKFELPQGTPTSTHAANLVFLPIDMELIAFCKVNGIVYTRYVDDLVFSSQQDFRHLTKSLVEIVTRSHKFKISYRKTKYEGGQFITGIPVHNNYIDAPEKIKLRAKEERLNHLPRMPLNNYLNNIRKTNTNCIIR
jgi:RNA-directed DNA polymerase